MKLQTLFRKTLYLLLIWICAFSLSGCGSDDTQQTGKEVEETVTSPEISDSAQDQATVKPENLPTDLSQGQLSSGDSSSQGKPSNLLSASEEDTGEKIIQAKESTDSSLANEPAVASSPLGSPENIQKLKDEIKQKYGISAVDGRTRNIGDGYRVTAGKWSESELRQILEAEGKLPEIFKGGFQKIERNSQILEKGSGGIYGLHDPNSGIIHMADLTWQHGIPLDVYNHERTHVVGNKIGS